MIVDTVFVDEAEELFPDPPTIEEGVVNDWLEMEDDGDRLQLDGILLADTEDYSKREIRDLDHWAQEA
jgi:hypothetical protein